jgi:hypothetical protein
MRAGVVLLVIRLVFERLTMRRWHGSDTRE